MQIKGSIILECKGIHTEKYFLPPFDLCEGEIIVLYLYEGAHFYETEMCLKDIFVGKTKHENVRINKPLTFVEHFREPALRRIFYPVTVGEYLRKKANSESPFATRIYGMEIEDAGVITKRRKVNSLEGTPRKILSLLSTLSHTDKIVFDLSGQCPQGAETTYAIVKEAVKNGGSAILLDWASDMKNDCSKYIELQWLDGRKIEPQMPFKIQNPIKIERK